MLKLIEPIFLLILLLLISKVIVKSTNKEQDDKLLYEWDLTFNLFQMEDKTKQTVLRLNSTDEEILDSGFEPNKKTKFIVHGWTHGLNKKDIFQRLWMMDTKDYILNKYDYNVILIDWSKPASDTNYVKVVAKLANIGKIIALLIKRLNTLTSVSINNIHCIGHSLGAHVCGFVGKTLSSPDKLGQITGLDPAEPLFIGPFTSAINSTDAKLVVIVHTASAIATSLYGYNGFIGHRSSLGHLDFFINGGETQPMCKKINIRKVFFRQIMTDKKNHPEFCHHQTAYKYPISESSNGCQMIAFECNNYEDFKEGKCAEEGKPVDYNFDFYDNPDFKLNRIKIPNNLFIMTSDTYPYCLFHYQIEIQLESNIIKNETIKLIINSSKMVELEFILNPRKVPIYFKLLTSNEELGSVQSVDYHPLDGNLTARIEKVTINYMSHIDKRYLPSQQT